MAFPQCMAVEKRGWRRERERKKERERGMSSLVSLPIRTLTSLDHGLMLMTSLNLDYFFRAPMSNTATLGLGLQHIIF